MNRKYTMTVVKPGKLPYTFLKPFPSLFDAINWAWDEIATEDIQFILIREGEKASDPVVWDSRDKVEHEVTDKPVWSHTPVPDGFPLKTVNACFEKRAAIVLSDYNSEVDFSTWQPHEKEGFRDYRYKQPSVRQAWMMYLDLALKHFDRFGTVV